MSASRFLGWSERLHLPWTGGAVHALFCAAPEIGIAPEAPAPEPAPSEATPQEPLAEPPSGCRRDLLLLTAAWFLASLVMLGQQTEFASREVRHALIAAEMAESGDYLVPHRLGKPYIFKPSLLHWSSALLYRCFGGPSIVLARFPSALAALAAAFALYALGRILYSPATGRWAGLILLATPGFALLSRTARPDMIMAAALLGSCLGLARGMLETLPRSRRWWFFLGGLSAGAALLTKGPYGIFYVGLFPGLFWLFAPLGRSRLRRPGLWECAIALLGMLILPLCWVIPVYFRDQGEYLKAVLGQHPPSSEHIRSFYWYAKVVPFHLLPWTLLLPWAAFKPRVKWSELGIVLLIFAVLSAVPGKRPHYLVPWYPLAALLVASILVPRFSRLPWRVAGRTMLVIGLSVMPFYYGVLQQVSPISINEDDDFAREVVQSLPDQACVACYKTMGEEVSFAHFVQGRRMDVQELYQPGQLDLWLAENLPSGQPLFLLVRPKEREVLGPVTEVKETLLLDREIRKISAGESSSSRWMLLRLDPVPVPAGAARSPRPLKKQKMENTEEE